MGVQTGEEVRLLCSRIEIEIEVDMKSALRGRKERERERVVCGGVCCCKGKKAGWLDQSESAGLSAVCLSVCLSMDLQCA